MEEAPSSPRHFFYEPKRASTRTLTGFEQRTQQSTTNDPIEQTIPPEELEENNNIEQPAMIENHAPYRDNVDDEEEEQEDVQSGAQFADVPPPPTMKPMSVSTGDDYAMGNDENTRQRKACFAAFVSVCFLILGYWITIGRESNNNSSYSFNGKGGHGGSSNNNNNNNNLGGNGGQQQHHHMETECTKDGFDANYFLDLLDRVEHWNQTEQCTKEFPIHDCKCHNPFLAIPQDQHPGWGDVVKKNIDLMKKNYTNRGFHPEVVIYGDSITEHLIGRHFGMENAKYTEHAKITQQLLTKRGGGHINGLPMGIAADQMAHLLYRLQNGEMPENLRPRVWWLLIGTNDIGFGCSIDAVVAGNIRIVKEIRERHNNQHGHKTLTPVVINSILPRGKFELHSDQSAYHRIIHRINQQLDCYAQLTNGVYFVNTTAIMTESFANNGTYLKQGYFAGDNLHPSAEGSRQWEELIVSNVMQFMT